MDMISRAFAAISIARVSGDSKWHERAVEALYSASNEVALATHGATLDEMLREAERTGLTLATRSQQLYFAFNYAAAIRGLAQRAILIEGTHS